MGEAFHALCPQDVSKVCRPGFPDVGPPPDTAQFIGCVFFNANHPYPSAQAFVDDGERHLIKIGGPFDKGDNKRHGWVVGGSAWLQPAYEAPAIWKGHGSIIDCAP